MVQLESIASSAFATGHYPGKILRAYHSTDSGTKVDLVALQHADAEMEGIFRNSCIVKRVIPRPRDQGEGDAVEAFKACLLADVREAVLTSDRTLPRLDSMTQPLDSAHADGVALGWLYHLDGDGTLNVYEYKRNTENSTPRLIRVRHGQFRHYAP